MVRVVQFLNDWLSGVLFSESSIVWFPNDRFFLVNQQHKRQPGKSGNEFHELVLFGEPKTYSMGRVVEFLNEWLSWVLFSESKHIQLSQGSLIFKWMIRMWWFFWRIKTIPRDQSCPIPMRMTRMNQFFHGYSVTFLEGYNQQILVRSLIKNPASNN